MSVNVAVFAVGNADYSTIAYPKFNGGIEANIFARGVLHSDTKIGLNSQPYLEQKLGHEFNLYEDRCWNSWEVGLDLYGKVGAKYNLVPDKCDSSEEDFGKFVKTFGASSKVNRYEAQAVVGTELIVRTPSKKFGNLKGTYAEFGVGAEAGVRYEGLNTYNEPLVHNDTKFNKLNPTINPFAEAVVHLGQSNVLVGVEANMRSAFLKVGIGI